MSTWTEVQVQQPLKDAWRGKYNSRLKRWEQRSSVVSTALPSGNMHASDVTLKFLIATLKKKEKETSEIKLIISPI